MTGIAERETPKQGAVRLRLQAQKVSDQRKLKADESEKALDEMIRRSIDLHGA